MMNKEKIKKNQSLEVTQRIKQEELLANTGL